MRLEAIIPLGISVHYLQADLNNLISIALTFFVEKILAFEKSFFVSRGNTFEGCSGDTCETDLNLAVEHKSGYNFFVI